MEEHDQGDFPHQVLVDLNSKKLNSSEILITEWCEENFGLDNFLVQIFYDNTNATWFYNVCFRKEEEAMIFNLVWSAS